MKLHHKIKPHHHVTIWLASFMMLAGSVLVYNSVLISRIQAQGTEPSSSTKKFFGFNDSGGGKQKFVEPAICKVNRNQDKENTLQAEMDTLQNQMNASNQASNQPPPSVNTQLTPQEQIAQQQQQVADQATRDALQTKINAVQAQMEALQKNAQRGPSNECKKAIVAQSIVEMERMYAQFTKDNKLNSTLDKVNTVISKVEAQVPALKAAGVSPATITKINVSIQSIKKNNAILRTFFTKMLGGISKYIAVAKADPLSSFDTMEKGGGFISEKDSTVAANAADEMVAAFTGLVAHLDSITTSQQGGQ